MWLRTPGAGLRAALARALPASAQALLFVTVRGAGGYEEEFQLTNVALPLE